MEYALIRSSRKTLAAEIKNGRLIVRAPLHSSEADINAFLEKHRSWIETHLSKSQAQQETASGQHLTMQDIRALGEKALEVIPKRVAYFAPLVGVTYGRITIRNQQTRWGSCSSKGNLNFNCLLMLAPPEVLDSVIVHELCHRKQPNHSAQFYAEVLRVFPEYRKWEKWLKDNGGPLMAMMTGPEP